jgi:two-component system, NarL family, nitrate/nitrite response regulator NarL
VSSMAMENRATTGAKVRLLLVDDHALFREGLGRLLEAEPDFEIVARCGSLDEAMVAVSRGGIDIVLLDYRLDQTQGSEFIRRAKTASFAGKVIVVTAGLTEEESRELLMLGISGIFFKHDPPGVLAHCIREVMQGRAWFNPEYLQSLLQPTPSSDASGPKPLTDRERAVLRGILEGLSNKEIGSRLDISESAVKGILQQLFSKTGVRTRSQLVRIALEQYRSIV